MAHPGPSTHQACPWSCHYPTRMPLTYRWHTRHAPGRLPTDPHPVDLDDIRQQFPEPAHFPNFFSTAHIPMFTETTLIMIQNGVYPYTDDLRTIESYRLNQTAVTQSTQSHSPLCVTAWAKELQSHPSSRDSTEARRGHLVPRKYSTLECTSILNFHSGMHFHSEIPLWNALPF